MRLPRMIGWRHYGHAPGDYGETAARAILVIYPPPRPIKAWRRKRAHRRYLADLLAKQAVCDRERDQRRITHKEMDLGIGPYKGFPEALAAYNERVLVEQRKIAGVPPPGLPTR